MVDKYMFTIPKYRYTKRKVFKYINTHDIKKWVVGYEQGKTGYRHLQIRMETSDSFEDLKTLFPLAHIEKANEKADFFRYERKGGRYLSSEDTPDKMETRFRNLRNAQQAVINAVKTQSVREVDVWFDEQGNNGKSWLCNALYERGIAFYCPATLRSIDAMVKFVCSGYDNEEMIVIDIPRAYKWTDADYIAIEQIKDGLIADDRYSAKIRNIRGVKVLVMCNSMPKVGKLSADRWRIHTTEELSRCEIQRAPSEAKANERSWNINDEDTRGFRVLMRVIDRVGTLNRTTNRVPFFPPLGGKSIEMQGKLS